MIRWFTEAAPIRRKLTIVFSVQAAWLVGCIAAMALAWLELVPPEAALGCGLLILLLASGSGAVMRECIAGPYVSTVVRMEALAAGDLEAPIGFTTHKDCVGRMTKAMQCFRAGALARSEAEAEAAEHREAAATLRREQDAAREQLLHDQGLVVDQLASGLAALAAGNLVDRLDQPFPPEYERLRHSFNEAVSKVQDTMRSVSVSSATVRSGSETIAQAADDLSQRTEQQAASLEQTAAALDQITATVRRTAEGSQQARTTVSAAKQDAEHSGAVMRDAITAMGEIETSAREIGAIIGTMDEIAFQTNLLALNAGVEAARAGDAGRGFAVVASEVRALAQRSADAAKEIKALISASSRQVEAGVGLVARTGKALDRIVEQVAEINGVVADIAASAQEQATGLQEVNTAVNQMDQVTQQNAAMVEESTAASHSLLKETDSLSTLLARFQIGPVPSTQAAVAVRPAPSRGRVQLKVVAPDRGRALAPADDRWDEF